MKFTYLSNLLKVFVGLLLGFFLTSSVNRWGDAVGGFLTLFGAIRNLMLQFHALGCSEERRRMVARYGLLSCEFLVVELRLRTTRDRDLQKRERQAVRDLFVSQGRLLAEEE